MMGLGLLLALGCSLIPWAYARFLPKMLKEFPAAGLLDPSAVDAGPYLAAMVLLVGMALVGYCGLHDQRRPGAFWAAGATLALVVLIAVQLAFPLLNRFFIAPPQELAYAAGLNLGPADHFVVYGATRPSTVFYAKRRTIFVPSGEEDTIRVTLARPGRTMLLLPESYYANLPAQADRLIPLLKRYGYLLLANEPMVNVPEPAPAQPSTPIPGH